MVDWLMDCSVDWSIDWLIDWLIDWMIGWLILLYCIFFHFHFESNRGNCFLLLLPDFIHALRMTGPSSMSSLPALTGDGDDEVVGLKRLIVEVRVNRLVYTLPFNGIRFFSCRVSFKNRRRVCFHSLSVKETCKINVVASFFPLLFYNTEGKRSWTRRTHRTVTFNQKSPPPSQPRRARTTVHDNTGWGTVLFFSWAGLSFWAFTFLYPVWLTSVCSAHPIAPWIVDEQGNTADLRTRVAGLRG